MTTDPARLDLDVARRRFDRIAARFADADYVHRKAFDGIVERLSPVILDPRTILDLGSAHGTGSRRLARLYRGARIISLDASAKMLAECRRRRSMFSRIRECQADAMQIPLQTGSIDLVVANLLLPWIDDLPACLAGIGRVLKNGGVFAFATLGPDSFAELRQAWQRVDAEPHVRDFPDMHDVGDALLRSGLRDPVLDAESLHVTFPDSAALLRDLSDAGAGNCLVGRRPTLTGKMRFRQLRRELAKAAADDRLSLRLELVYGHAWGAGQSATPGEYLVAPGAIGRRAGR